MAKNVTQLLIVLSILSLAACVSNTPEPSEPSADKEPSAEPSAQKEKEPSASKEKEPSANQKKEPSAAQKKAAADLAEQKRLEEAKQKAEQEAERLKLEAEILRQEQEAAAAEEAEEANRQATAALCHAIGSKLGSVSIDECNSHRLTHAGFSTDGMSIAYREYAPVEGREPLGRVLVLGGIHGDEFSSVSVVFKWMAKLERFHSGLFHWRIVPSVNPDGLLRRKSQRQNSNGIDLNRNFPTTDWDPNAREYWEHETKHNPRRNPGQHAASEIETQWVVEQIKTFQPDVIISMHAPYHLVDYDGPPTAPENLGGLYLRKLGVYPGSLGNYVGVDMNKPIVTVELKSAGIMPRQSEIDSMWNDLVGWLRKQLEPS